MKHLRFVRRIVLAGMVACLSVGNTAGALGPVLFSGVQVKGVGANTSSLEAVEVKSYSDTDTEVTNWCIAYASYTSTTTPSGGSCVMPLSTGDKVFLKAHSAFSFTTAELTNTIRVTNPQYVPDGILNSGLGNATGQLFLLDTSKQPINNIKWYTGPSSVIGHINLRPATGAPENISFTRTGFGEDGSSGFVTSPTSLNFVSGGLYDLIDVCKNVSGFQEIIPPDYSELDGQCTPVDVCSNVDGIQQKVPDGLTILDGRCIQDQCDNIIGIQEFLPTGYVKDELGHCLVDACPNLTGLQASLPAGYYLDASDCSKYEDRALVISELLPNVAGSDTGLEYVELFNPYDEQISLKGYKLGIGKNFEKLVTLPETAAIPAHGYYVATNAELDFTLLNTSSGVSLTTPAGAVVSQTVYENPADNASWSMIDGSWQYTTQRTPGSANLPTPEVIEEITVISPLTTHLASCGIGKYRHPVTNRCRNLESDVVTLASCDNDEYRNPETNRCRKISALTSSLTPCGENQERNPDTNRCRNVLSASTSLTPCQDGYERNPETNRCRKSVVATSELAAVAQSASEPAGSGSISPYTLGFSVAGLAFGYGLFEWRKELFGLFGRLLPFNR